MQSIGKTPAIFSLLGSSQKRLFSTCRKVRGELALFWVAKGREPCQTQSFRQGKPPSARYGGHGSDGG